MEVEGEVIDKAFRHRSSGVLFKPAAGTLQVDRK